MNDSQIVDPQVSQPRRTVPAWLLSVTVHVVLVLVLGLLVRNVAKSQGDEGGRAVGLVLATADDGSDVDFFTEDDQSQDSQGEATSPENAAAEKPAEESALPEGSPSDAEKLFPDIALPGGESLQGGADDLLKSPSLQVSPSTRVLPGQGDSEILNDEILRRKRRQGPSGPPTEVSLFGSAPARGHSFVFVIDRSKSMGGSGLGALEAAQRELEAALAPLQPNHKFEIVAYHNRPVYFSQSFNERKQLVVASDRNKARVKSFFGGLAPFGYTEHEMAIKAGLWLKPDVIYFLTDGGLPPLNDGQISRLRRMALSQGTTIHSIQFGAGPRQGSDFMERLAVATKGGYGYVDMRKR